MRKVAFVPIWALLLACPAIAEIIDRALAVVGGSVITLSDVNAADRLGLVDVEATGDRTAAVLAKLIDRQLILIEVDRYAPAEPTSDALDAQVQRARARFASGDLFTQTLARLGLDEKRFRQMLRDDLRLRAYLDQRFTTPVPGEDEVDQYYREHQAEFTRNGRLLTREAANAEIVRTLAESRRTMMIQEWVDGLRRRASITDLYLTRP